MVLLPLVIPLKISRLCLILVLLTSGYQAKSVNLLILHVVSLKIKMDYVDDYTVTLCSLYVHTCIHNNLPVAPLQWLLWTPLGPT